MKMKDTGVKRKIRNDIILVLCLLLIAVIGLAYLYLFRDKGDTVKVTVDGNQIGIYSLNENMTKDIITGEKGENLNRLIIKDGKAYMETATCPDGICVNHNPIFRDGESIVCLPNGVVVTIIKNDDDLDVVIYAYG
ncbi:MAG: NusG domain II-containing protein [Ruminococcaceae bacterium]|nr:NusG domain II-containing protein [Oscillospiraceae bacterium]